MDVRIDQPRQDETPTGILLDDGLDDGGTGQGWADGGDPSLPDRDILQSLPSPQAGVAQEKVENLVLRHLRSGVTFACISSMHF